MRSTVLSQLMSIFHELSKERSAVLQLERKKSFKTKILPVQEVLWMHIMCASANFTQSQPTEGCNCRPTLLLLSALSEVERLPSRVVFVLG